LKRNIMTNIATATTNSWTRGRLGRSSATVFAVLVAFLGIAFSLLLKVALHDKPSISISSSSSLPFSSYPELYHGEGKTHHFFEGWYHKIVRTRMDCNSNSRDKDNNRESSSLDPDGDNDSLSMAVVPGVFYDSGNNATGKNESHAFIFVTINGEKQHYYRFDIDTEFQYKRHQEKEDKDDHYYVRIGNNTFSKHGMSLDLAPRRCQDCTKDDSNDDDANDDASISLKGSIEYEAITPWPIPSVWNLGAMGPVGYFLSPFLECFHDVLSFDHRLKGTLAISKSISKQEQNNGDGNEKDDIGAITLEEFFNSECNGDGNDNDNNNDANTFVSSRGYVEKDRGQSFPSLWIWMQTNAFRKNINVGTSLFFSVARIPILTNLRKFIQFLPRSWTELEFPGFTAAVLLNGSVEGAAAANDASSTSSSSVTGYANNTVTTKRLIPFATWSGAYFEDLVVDDDRVVATLNSGGIGGGFWGIFGSPQSSSSSSSSEDDTTIVGSSAAITIRFGRFVKAWTGSWFLNYDSRKLRYKLELVADRRVPHVLLYAPKTTITTSDTDNGTNAAATMTTSKMEPFVNEALNAKIAVRLFEYYRSDDGIEYERLLLDDVGEHAGLEVHQNVQYLVDNICGKAEANIFMCL